MNWKTILGGIIGILIGCVLITVSGYAPDYSMDWRMAKALMFLVGSIGCCGIGVAIILVGIIDKTSKENPE